MDQRPNRSQRISTLVLIIVGIYAGFFATLGSALLLFELIVFLGFPLPPFLARAIAIILAILWGFIMVRFSQNYIKESKRLFLLTPEQFKAEQKAKELEAKLADRRLSEFLKIWYIRYSLAVLCIGIAYFIIVSDPALWIMSLIYLILAAYFAYEFAYGFAYFAYALVVIVITIILIYTIFNVAAGLPLSVAVIIGAIIIAVAIGMKRKK